MQPDVHKEFDTLKSWSTRIKPSGNVHPRRSAELENMVMSLPNITNHRLGTAAYKAAVKAITALERGIINVLTREQITRITEAMAIPPRNGHRPFTRAEISEFLNKQFTREERQELYQSLSKHYNPAYNQKVEGKGSLAHALYSFSTGYCLLMKLWYHPPKLPKRAIITVIPELEEVISMAQETLQDDSNNTKATLTINIKHLEYYFRQVLRPNMNVEQRRHYGSFYAFVSGYIDFLQEQYETFRKEPSCGWFKPSCKALPKWIQEINERIEP